MESHDETGCQTSDVPMPCVNNCGFFGTAATMFMCSKCHKDMVLKEEQVKVAASSFGNIMNGGSSGEEPVVTGNVDVQAGPVEPKVFSVGPSAGSFSFGSTDGMAKEGPNRCTMCRKRVGLTGFHCKCGNLFCSVHRYSDKHDCQFDYRAAAQDALAKANPVVKASKLDKI